MAEIFRPDFKNKKKGVEENKTVKSGPEKRSKEEMMRELQDSVKELRKIGERMKNSLSVEVAEKIKRLQFSPSTLSEQRDIISQYSDIELVGWFNRFDEKTSSGKAAFFRAIVEELEKRDYFFI